jgi:hypothetical protein
MLTYGVSMESTDWLSIIERKHCTSSVEASTIEKDHHRIQPCIATAAAIGVRNPHI